MVMRENTIFNIKVFFTIFLVGAFVFYLFEPQDTYETELPQPHANPKGWDYDNGNWLYYEQSTTRTKRERVPCRPFESELERELNDLIDRRVEEYIDDNREDLLDDY